MDSDLEFEKDKGIYHYQIADLMMIAVIHVLQDKMRSFPIDQSYIQNLIPLPFELPPRFVEQLGYRRDRRFVAAWWEPAGDELTLRDDSCEWCGANGWPYLAFKRQPQVQTWL
jgi:hypothetical protein